MNRRSLLATTCVSLVGFAGCSRSDTKQGPQTTSSKRISEYDCSPHDIDVESAVCSHTVDSEAASVYLLPSKPTGAESPSEVDLTLHNESSTELEFNPYQWEINKRSNAGWVPIEAHSSGTGQLTLSPSETHKWTFGEVIDFINKSATVDSGTYTASIRVPRPEDSGWIRCLSLFRLE